MRTKGSIATIALLGVIALQGAFGQSFVLDLQYNPMSFLNSKRTVLVNNGSNGLSQGSVHKYADVATVNGITIYAKVTLLEMNKATIVLFDDDAITGEQNRFQPRIGSSDKKNGGYIVYKMEFFDKADDAPVFLYNYYMTGVDIDGNDNADREYIEVSGYASYQLDKSTRLTVSANNATGRTRFLGRNSSLAGVTFENTAAFIANFSTPNNVITFAMGMTANNDERYYSVQFGAKGGNFTTPVVTNNPLPMAIDDVGTPLEGISGGTSVENVLANDIYDGRALVASEYTLTLVSAASHAGVTLNTATGKVTVAAGTPAGNYELSYQITMKSNTANTDIAKVFVEVTAPQNITNHYPAAGPGTLAFEDMWPSRGDYDFNDLIIDYRFEINTNGRNYVKNITATFTVRAFGASLKNGFGFALSSKIDPATLTVKGSTLTESYVKLSGNGTEAGQKAPVIIVFDNTFSLMKHPGSGTGVNTDPSAPWVEPVTLTIEITFPTDRYSYTDLDIANFNPFLIVAGNRGREVHLADYMPTDLADLSLLGTDDDSSNPGAGRYYRRESNLPWGINLYESFDYPVEKSPITDVHLKFDDWAISGGKEYTDWYQSKLGYRNQDKIFQRK